MERFEVLGGSIVDDIKSFKKEKWDEDADCRQVAGQNRHDHFGGS